MVNENLRLQLAAIATRDDLRAQILPACEQLSKLVGSNAEAEQLIRKIEALALKNADTLRFAMKDRAPASKARQARANQNLPCWTIR